MKIAIDYNYDIYFNYVGLSKYSRQMSVFVAFCIAMGNIASVLMVNGFQFHCDRILFGLRIRTGLVIFGSANLAMDRT